MKNIAFYAIAFLLIGAGLGSAVTYAIQTNGSQTTDSQTTETTSMSGMDHSKMNMGSSDMSSMSMDDMMKELKGKTGDEFDKAFLAMMIEHHNGAVDMANAAKTNAKHAEIKAMADEIISAQTREITQMKEWQQQWGY